MALMLTLGAVVVGVQSGAPVADAAQRGDIATVRTLLRDGADVSAAQGDGMTALHWSALNGQLEIMNVLLYAGATTEPLTRVGRYTPLHLASSRGHAAAVSRLLEAGSKPGALTETGVQPLHLAAQAGNGSAVKALLDRGAEVNARDGTHGRTPLVFAVSQNRLEAMKVLIAKGADVRLATNVIDYRSAQPPTTRRARPAIALSLPRQDAQPIRISISTIRRQPARPGEVRSRRSRRRRCRWGRWRRAGSRGTGRRPSRSGSAGRAETRVGHRTDRPSGRIQRIALRRA